MSVRLPFNAIEQTSLRLSDRLDRHRAQELQNDDVLLDHDLDYYFNMMIESLYRLELNLRTCHEDIALYHQRLEDLSAENHLLRAKVSAYSQARI